MDRFKGCHLFLEKCFTLIMFCTELRHLLDGVSSVGFEKYLFQSIFSIVEKKTICLLNEPQCLINKVLVLHFCFTEKKEPLKSSPHKKLINNLNRTERCHRQSHHH